VLIHITDYTVGVFESQKPFIAKSTREASQTRDYCVAALLIKSCATLRAARPDPSPRKKRLLGMTIKLQQGRE
jgi:hypothetical protein